MNRCAACRRGIQGEPHEWIPTMLADGRIAPMMHAICSAFCGELCRRGTVWMQQGPWPRITDHLEPVMVEAICHEHGRQAYSDWEARRGIAPSERVN